MNLKEQQARSRSFVVTHSKWDIVEVMTSAEGMTYIFEIHFPDEIDRRISRFYPRTCLTKMGDHHPVDNQLQRRYEQALEREDISIDLGFEEFREPRQRLIGNYPDPTRAVLLVDDIYLLGRTLRSCKKDFQAMGYDRNKIFVGHGFQIYPFDNLINRLSGGETQ